MEHFFITVGEKDVNLSMLISSDDQQQLQTYFSDYRHTVGFLHAAVSDLRKSKDTYAEIVAGAQYGGPKALNAAKDAVKIIDGCIGEITLGFINRVEQYYRDKYSICVEPYINKHPLQHIGIISSYGEIVKPIYEQHGPDLYAQGVKQSRQQIFSLLMTGLLPVKVTCARIAFTDFIFWNNSNRDCLSNDSTAYVASLLTILSAHVASQGKTAIDHRHYLTLWRQHGVRRNYDYELHNGYYIRFYANGRLDLLCPDNGQALALLKEIKTP